MNTPPGAAAPEPSLALEPETIKRNPMFMLPGGADHLLDRRAANLVDALQQLRGGDRPVGRRAGRHDPVHPRNPRVPRAAGGVRDADDPRAPPLRPLDSDSRRRAGGNRVFPDLHRHRADHPDQQLRVPLLRDDQHVAHPAVFQDARVPVGLRETHQPGRGHQHRHRPADLGDDVLPELRPGLPRGRRPDRRGRDLGASPATRPTRRRCRSASRWSCAASTGCSTSSPSWPGRGARSSSPFRSCCWCRSSTTRSRK